MQLWRGIEGGCRVLWLLGCWRLLCSASCACSILLQGWHCVHLYCAPCYVCAATSVDYSYAYACGCMHDRQAVGRVVPDASAACALCLVLQLEQLLCSYAAALHRACIQLTHGKLARMGCSCMLDCRVQQLKCVAVKACQAAVAACPVLALVFRAPALYIITCVHLLCQQHTLRCGAECCAAFTYRMCCVQK